MNCRLILSFCGCLTEKGLGMREGTFIFLFHSLEAEELQLYEELSERMKVSCCIIL